MNQFQEVKKYLKQIKKLKTLLIIGGSGFFGKSIIDYINSTNYNKWKISKIIIISKKKKSFNLKKKINNKFKLIRIFMNILDIKTLPRSDYIIYAIHSKNNIENKKGIINFRNLLKNYPKQTKILLTSSGSVYGDFSSKKKLKESQKINYKKLNSLKGYKKNYSKIKILMEKTFILLGRKKFNVSIARCFSFIGPRILNKRNYAISNFIDQSINKKSIIVKSQIQSYRSYMYADDLAYWLLNILISSNPSCPIYNVGSDKPYSLYKVASIVSKIFKKPIISNYKKSNLIEYYVPSILKAKNKLGLSIKYSLKKSINLTAKGLK